VSAVVVVGFSLLLLLSLESFGEDPAGTLADPDDDEAGASTVANVVVTAVVTVEVAFECIVEAS